MRSIATLWVSSKSCRAPNHCVLKESPITAPTSNKRFGKSPWCRCIPVCAWTPLIFYPEYAGNSGEEGIFSFQRREEDFYCIGTRDKSPPIAALLKLADEMAFHTERHNTGKLNLLINIALFIILFFPTRYFAGKYTSCVYFCLLML